MSNSKRKCKYCKKYFHADIVVSVPAGTFCSMEHAVKWVSENKKQCSEIKRKVVRKEVAAAKEKIKTRQEWIRDAQRWFNKFIRLRDAIEPCISCGRYHNGQYHAGHYRTTAAAPQIRFDEDNCHKQCSACNNHLSGNIEKYRLRLIEKIGVERVEALENNSEIKRWEIDELKEIKAKYKTLCRDLEKK
jgi:hypothetical protein